MFKVASCDRQGAVYVDEDAVYRTLGSSHQDSVLAVLKAIDLAGIDGIVQTEVCTDSDFLARFNDFSASVVLKHKKVAHISYPHEWCASMLKDAALFHLELSEKLFKQGLFLKDAHPWNILFEKGRPVFVDFTSIVLSDALFEEDYLEVNRLSRDESDAIHLARVLKEIFERMYLPYFIGPLFVYSFGHRSRARAAIERTTLNASTSVISFKETLPELRLSRSTIIKLLGLLISQLDLKNVMKRFELKNNVPAFYQEMKGLVSNLKVEIGDTAYSAYYKLKGEDHDWSYSEEWNDKQKAVHNALNAPEIATVLDVACNTGWFAVLAERLGKSVVAFDIDEGCIEALYGQVKKQRLDILPLVMNFTELTQDRFSIYDGRKVLISAGERLRSDSVIALGIIHHLVLGLGLPFEKVLDQLISLCRKQLIVEFIDTNDSMIQNEPAFFPAYYRNRELLSGYNLGKLIALCEARGFEVQCEKSYPATRTILVCRKLPV